jgi:hypothetical protein
VAASCRERPKKGRAGKLPVDSVQEVSLPARLGCPAGFGMRPTLPPWGGSSTSGWPPASPPAIRRYRRSIGGCRRGLRGRSRRQAEPALSAVSRASRSMAKASSVSPSAASAFARNPNTSGRKGRAGSASNRRTSPACESRADAASPSAGAKPALTSGIRMGANHCRPAGRR